jgi:hypothetical protein
VSTVSDGPGVGDGVGCAAGVDVGAELAGCGDMLLLLESGTAGGGGAGAGDICAVAAESGAAVAAESPAFTFEPEQAAPNAITAPRVAETRTALIAASPPTSA